MSYIRDLMVIHCGMNIWWQRSGSTLAQVMASCLTTPSHYQNQRWFVISEVLCHPRVISQWALKLLFSIKSLKNTLFKITPKSPRIQRAFAIFHCDLMMCWEQRPKPSCGSQMSANISQTKKVSHLGTMSTDSMANTGCGSSEFSGDLIGCSTQSKWAQLWDFFPCQ